MRTIGRTTLFRLAVRLSWAPLLAAPAVLGCGDDTPPLAAVTGTLTYQGKAVGGMTVTFLPDKGGRPSWGITNDQGQYKLSWDAGHDGVEIGMHKVIIAYVPGTPMEEAGYGDASKKKGKAAESESKTKTASRTPEAAALDAKYGKFDTTPLSKEVKPGKQVIDLTLTE